MTHLTEMSDEELNVRLAELRGIPAPHWHCAECGVVKLPVCECGRLTERKNLPDYTQSLDAVAEVERTLQCNESDYYDRLSDVIKGSGVPIYRATARQRTIALIATLQ